MHKNINLLLPIKVIILAFALLLMLTGINMTSFAEFSADEPILLSSTNSEFEKSWTCSPYFTQSVHLKWQEEGGIKDFQGLLVPELGTIIKNDSQSDISLYLDFSVSAQIYDIYNIQFAPTNFNINEAYLNYKTDFSNRYLPANLKCELYPDNDLFNLGMESEWFRQNNLEVYTEILLYDLFSCADDKLPDNNCGLTIGAQWSDIFNREDDKCTNFKIEFSSIDKQALLQINQKIDSDLFFEITYTTQPLISTSLNYDIYKNWQLELSALFSNIQEIDNQPNQNIREFSLITAFIYKF